ncbi:MAG: hypothetical protein ACLVJK_05380 [Alistipes putredinis]
MDNGSVDDKYYTIPSLSSISVPAAGNYIGDEDRKRYLRCPAGVSNLPPIATAGTKLQM